MDNVKLGTLVLVKQHNLSPTCWQLDRIVEVYPGKDNLIRIVKLNAVNGKLQTRNFGTMFTSLCSTTLNVVTCEQ